jgi:hypothetical protein
MEYLEDHVPDPESPEDPFIRTLKTACGFPDNFVDSPHVSRLLKLVSLNVVENASKVRVKQLELRLIALACNNNAAAFDGKFYESRHVENTDRIKHLEIDLENLKTRMRGSARKFTLTKKNFEKEKKDLSDRMGMKLVVMKRRLDAAVGAYQDLKKISTYLHFNNTELRLELLSTRKCFIRDRAMIVSLDAERVKLYKRIETLKAEVVARGIVLANTDSVD